MILYPRTSEGELDLSQGFELSGLALGSGGEGTVFDLTAAPAAYQPLEQYVVKRFKEENKVLDENLTAQELPCLPEKLEALIEKGAMYSAEEGCADVTFPLVTLYKDNGILGGYLMRKAEGRTLRDVALRYELKKTGWTFRTLTDIGLQIVRGIRKLHTLGLIVGDLSTSNILVDSSARVTIIDSDSFQVGNTYRCRVQRSEYSSPKFLERTKQLDGRTELPPRKVEDDDYAAAVVLYSLFMGSGVPMESDSGFADKAAGLRFRHFTYRYFDTSLNPRDLWTRIWHNFTPRMRSAFDRTFARPKETYTSLDEWIDILEEYDDALRRNIAGGGIYKQSVRFTDKDDLLQPQPPAYFMPGYWKERGLEALRYGTYHTAKGAGVHPVRDSDGEVAVVFEFRAEHIRYINSFNPSGAFRSNVFFVSLREHTDANGFLNVEAYLKDMEEAGAFDYIKEHPSRKSKEQPLLFVGGDAVRSLRNYKDLSEKLKREHDVELVTLSPRKEAYMLMRSGIEFVPPVLHLHFGEYSSWLRHREMKDELTLTLCHFTGLGALPLQDGFFRMCRPTDSLSRRLEEHDSIIREYMALRMPNYPREGLTGLLVTGYPIGVFSDGTSALREKILDEEAFRHVRETFLEKADALEAAKIGALFAHIEGGNAELTGLLRARLMLPVLESLTEYFKPGSVCVISQSLAKAVKDQAYQFPYRDPNIKIT